MLFVALMGVIPFFAIDASYWNWYDYPTTYVLAQPADQVAGFALAGLVMAKLLRY